MYDAFADMTANIKALAGYNPINRAITMAKHAFNTGSIIAKGERINPALFKSPIRFAAQKPHVQQEEAEHAFKYVLKWL